MHRGDSAFSGGRLVRGVFFLFALRAMTHLESPESGSRRQVSKFETIRSKLAGTEAILQGDEAYSRQRTDEILRARARALARTAERETLDKSVVLLLCRLGDQRYAIPLVKVVEIQPLGSFANVPATPAFIMGVINVRGQIFTVVDLAVFFGIRGDEKGQTGRSILIVGDVGNRVGLLVDEVLGIAHYHPGEIHSLKLNLPNVKSDYISGSTADAVAVLNLDELLSDRKMLVEDV